jgi:hypothetical protein
MRLIPAGFDCAACGSPNDTTVDPSQGRRQEYVEDCRTCCRANLLRVELEPEGGEARIEATLEDG